MALSVKNRIKKKKEIDLIFQKGTTIRGAFLFIKYLKNNLAESRFLVIVPARLYKKAVSRNRIKRVLIEQIKLADKIKGYDTLILIRKTAEEPFLKNELSDILKQLK